LEISVWQKKKQLTTAHEAVVSCTKQAQLIAFSLDTCGLEKKYLNYFPIQFFPNVPVNMENLSKQVAGLQN